MEKLGAFGIDIGSKFSTICAVSNGVIEAVLNESSSRNSPTVIGFCEAERLISDAAVQQMGRNHKNTVAFINRFMGLNADCTEQLAFERGFITNDVEVVQENKKIFFKVQSKGEVLRLFPEQIYGAFLSNLRQFFSHHAERPDVVIAVPPYYSAVERQAVLDACRIGNIHCLKLVNEDTAVALSYGFFRRKEFDEKNARNVAFLDFGHAKTTVTIASFTQKKVKILARAFSRNLGARNFDKSLLEKIGGEFEKKYGCDPRTNPKARLRMLESIEKARIILSANQESSVNIECLLEDNDLQRNISRTEFEEMIASNVTELKVVL